MHDGLNMRVVTRPVKSFAGNRPILREPTRAATMCAMAESPKIDVSKLKRDIIECTGPGKPFTRRKLSLLASDDRNPDLVRDFINREQNKQPTVATVVGLATAMGKDPAEYFVGAVTTLPEVERIAVIGRVQAGAWSEHPSWPQDDWYWIEVDPTPYPGAERYALEMVGHSMDKVIPPGSIIECLRVFDSGGPTPRSGDIVVVERQRNDLFEMTCKRLEITHDGVYVLHCESHRPEFREPVFMGKPDEESFSDDGTRIVGIVDKATQRFFRRGN